MVDNCSELGKDEGKAVKINLETPYKGVGILDNIFPDMAMVVKAEVTKSTTKTQSYGDGDYRDCFGRDRARYGSSEQYDNQVLFVFELEKEKDLKLCAECKKMNVEGLLKSTTPETGDEGKEMKQSMLAVELQQMERESQAKHDLMPCKFQL
ncbi:hypothetical protein SUGI_0665200 [Cryptomeria japonica]|nr:hypothetical protein SUGI_0665200 [Cryptomeria japonica]